MYLCTGCHQYIDDDYNVGTDDGEDGFICEACVDERTCPDCGEIGIKYWHNGTGGIPECNYYECKNFHQWGHE